jgi:hypothetical protein
MERCRPNHHYSETERSQRRKPRGDANRARKISPSDATISAHVAIGSGKKFAGSDTPGNPLLESHRGKSGAQECS